MQDVGDDGDDGADDDDVDDGDEQEEDEEEVEEGDVGDDGDFATDKNVTDSLSLTNDFAARLVIIGRGVVDEDKGDGQGDIVEQEAVSDEDVILFFNFLF